MTRDQREWLRHERSRVLLERLKARKDVCGECGMPLATGDYTPRCSRCYDRNRRVERNRQRRERARLIRGEPTSTQRARTAREKRECKKCGTPWEHITPGCPPCQDRNNYRTRKAGGPK